MKLGTHMLSTERLSAIDAGAVPTWSERCALTIYDPSVPPPGQPLDLDGLDASDVLGWAKVDDVANGVECLRAMVECALAPLPTGTAWRGIRRRPHPHLSLWPFLYAVVEGDRIFVAFCWSYHEKTWVEGHHGAALTMWIRELRGGKS